MRYILGSRWISCGWHCYTGEGKNHGLYILHNLGAKRHCGTSTRRRAPVTRLHSAVSTIGRHNTKYIWKLNLVLKRIFINNSPILIQVWMFIFFSMLVVVFLLTLLTAIHYRLVRSNKSDTTTSISSQFPIWQTASNYAMYVINTITNQDNSNSKL